MVSALLVRLTFELNLKRRLSTPVILSFLMTSDARNKMGHYQITVVLRYTVLPTAYNNIVFN